MFMFHFFQKNLIFHDPSFFSTSFVILHHLSSSVIIFHLHNHGLSLLLSPDALAQAWSPYPWFPEPRRGWWRQTRKPKQSQPTDKPYDLYYEKWNKRWGTESFLCLQIGPTSNRNMLLTILKHCIHFIIAQPQSEARIFKCSTKYESFLCLQIGPTSNRNMLLIILKHCIHFVIAQPQSEARIFKCSHFLTQR